MVEKQNKTKGKTIANWGLATNKDKSMTYMTTSIQTPFAKRAEFWAPFLQREGKIKNNSAYEVARYLLTIAIANLDKELIEKYK